MSRHEHWFALAEERCESAMNATPSAAASPPLAGRAVHHLVGHGEELELHREPVLGAELERIGRIGEIARNVSSSACTAWYSTPSPGRRGA